jgi:hypothetical protein
MWSEPFTTDGVGLINPKKAEKFFYQYHKTLKEMGVDGVKVDAQSVVSSLNSERWVQIIYRPSDEQAIFIYLDDAEDQDGTSPNRFI